VVALRLAAGELPQIAIEAAELALHLEHALRVVHRGVDLEPVAHDAGIHHQGCDLALAVASDQRRVEAVEHLAVAPALLQDREPRQAGLGTLEHQELEQLAIVVQRHAPLGVVVGDVDRIGADPGAARTGGRGASLRLGHEQDLGVRWR
jgi:hypothetical protein